MIRESARHGDTVTITADPGTGNRQEAGRHVRRYCETFTMHHGRRITSRARFLHRDGDTFTYRLIRKTAP